MVRFPDIKDAVGNYFKAMDEVERHVPGVCLACRRGAACYDMREASVAEVVSYSAMRRIAVQEERGASPLADAVLAYVTANDNYPTANQDTPEGEAEWAAVVKAREWLRRLHEQ